jgi:hypothetical protein
MRKLQLNLVYEIINTWDKKMETIEMQKCSVRYERRDDDKKAQGHIPVSHF